VSVRFVLVALVIDNFIFGFIHIEHDVEFWLMYSANSRSFCLEKCVTLRRSSRMICTKSSSRM
jgi:hypothetical protein